MLVSNDFFFGRQSTSKIDLPATTYTTQPFPFGKKIIKVINVDLRQCKSLPEKFKIIYYTFHLCVEC